MRCASTRRALNYTFGSVKQVPFDRKHAFVGRVYRAHGFGHGVRNKRYCCIVSGIHVCAHVRL